uniref:Uncharacterized protein n=1 Tax=Triticum urartu TaxID=4572 RepID=A0A8R7P4U4_TRIUA
HPLFPNPIISSFPNLTPPSRCCPHTTQRPKPKAPAPAPTTFVPPAKPARWSPHATASQTLGVPPSARISSSAVRDRGASSAHHPPLRSSCAVHCRGAARRSSSSTGDTCTSRSQQEINRRGKGTFDHQLA